MTSIDIIKYYAKLFASYYHSSVASYEDYFQDGYIIYLQALQKYNPDRGSFNTYLKQCLINGLKKKADTNITCVSIPPYIIPLSYKVHKLQQQNMDAEQIQQELNISHKRYLELSNIVSHTLFENDISIENNIIDKIFLDEILEKLEKTDKIILKGYILEYDIKDIALRLDKQYEWVRRRLRKILHEINRKTDN